MWKIHRVPYVKVLVLFLPAGYPSSMSSGAAPRQRPPSPPQAAPAGASSDPTAPSELIGTAVDRERRRGRGAQSNAVGRLEPHGGEGFDDGWQSPEDLPPFQTTVALDTARKVITRNDSPDIPFDRSINPYRGCEHGCIYCFARPTHAYLGLSPGLDFESRIFVKEDAPALLRAELSKPSYKPRPIALGVNTDAYQPIEKKLRLPPRILEVLHEVRPPVTLITKSALIQRDIDIIAAMARDHLACAAVSVTTLDR